MQDKTRVVPLSALPDCRVDVCLALIAPHKSPPKKLLGWLGSPKWSLSFL